MLENQSFGSFDAAGRAILTFLHSKLGFKLWMVTRTEGRDWIVLQSEDHGYNVRPGSVFRWSDSFCARMVEGQGPCIAPTSSEVPAYAAAPIGRQVKIGAYVGVPLNRPDGELFGTLCAIDPSPQPEAITSELPLVEMLARLLCTILELELQAAEHQRQTERANADAMTDALTGVYNRRGWDQLTAAEESRCIRFGNPASVLAIDLDGLKKINDEQGHARGDQLICNAANAIRGAVREQDVVARLGGDEFAVLGVECDAEGAASLRDRVLQALAEVQVEASIGVAVRQPGLGMAHAIEMADEAMYVCKRGRKALCRV